MNAWTTPWTVATVHPCGCTEWTNHRFLRLHRVTNHRAGVHAVELTNKIVEQLTRKVFTCTCKAKPRRLLPSVDPLRIPPLLLQHFFPDCLDPEQPHHLAPELLLQPHLFLDCLDPPPPRLFLPFLPSFAFLVLPPPQCVAVKRQHYLPRARLHLGPPPSNRQKIHLQMRAKTLRAFGCNGTCLIHQICTSPKGFLFVFRHVHTQKPTLFARKLKLRKWQIE